MSIKALKIILLPVNTGYPDKTKKQANLAGLLLVKASDDYLPAQTITC